MMLRVYGQGRGESTELTPRRLFASETAQFLFQLPDTCFCGKAGAPYGKLWGIDHGLTFHLDTQTRVDA